MNEFNNLKIFNFLRQAKIDNAALTQEELYMNVLKKAVDSEILPNEVLIKARSGVYADTPENRKKGRIGTRYGAKVHGGDTYDLENGGKDKSIGRGDKVVYNGKEEQVFAIHRNEGKVLFVSGNEGSLKTLQMQNMVKKEKKEDKKGDIKTPMTFKQVLVSKYAPLVEAIEHGSSDKKVIKDYKRELELKTGYKYTD